jgi:hypothetical protein
MRRMQIPWIVFASFVLVFALVLTAAGVYAQTDIEPSSITCTELLANGDFEDESDWTLTDTAVPARYSEAQVHGGTQSLRAGIVDPSNDRFAYSSAYQTLTIPAGLQVTTFTLWWYPISAEGTLSPTLAAADAGISDALLQAMVEGVAPAEALANDRQYVVLTDEQNNVLERLVWTRSDARSWQRVRFDISDYSGQTVRLHIGVVNDGIDGPTAMYVDDVSASSCTGHAGGAYLPLISGLPMQTVPPTPTPEPEEPWGDPYQPIEVFSPVANGQYHSPMLVSGFSQTFEGNVNVRLTAAGGQVLAQQTTPGGSVEGFDFYHIDVRFTVTQPVSATLEVYDTGAGDGSEFGAVAVPVQLLPGQRVIDLNSPAVGADVCSPIPVSGLSNTFEGVVDVNLSLRNGTEVTRTTAMGGNLGVYAPFSTTISYTVPSPRGVLVGAFEESAAGTGPIDYSRVPVTLHPAGTSTCP